MRFWVPKDYDKERRKGAAGKKYPVVVSFHGGGFTLGEAMDDARWAAIVVEEVGAVVIGVDYRRGPERPFPTAVEDGVDAVMWIANHADELNLDVDRIALSGFSSGGNMAFTVPLRMQEEMLANGVTSAHGSEVSLLGKGLSQGQAYVNAKKEISVLAIVSWYPSTDYTQTREQRRATCIRPDQQLPAVFTSLFDQSYLQPPSLDLSNPYLSPGKAPDSMLAGLPEDIILITCEWDMLLKEGERLRDRLVHDLGKRVVYHCVPGVPHAWD
ncbi:MAG: alpha/beta hydrolase, partial [Terriglobus roseus]|nr:alpha/beta hydrolase [Terriglobus roseus]